MLVMIPVLAIFLVLLFIQPRELPFKPGKSPPSAAEKSDTLPEETP